MSFADDADFEPDSPMHIEGPKPSFNDFLFGEPTGAFERNKAAAIVHGMQKDRISSGCCRQREC